jgi:amino acid adenylation domain-containing protein
MVYLDADWPQISTESETRVDSGVIPDNLSYLRYTSGSTGRPKGVMITHRNVVNLFAAMDRVIPCDPPGVWLAVTSLSFDISVVELHWTLACGFRVVLYADQAREQALAEGSESAEYHSIPAQIKQHNVTHFQCTPSMASTLLLDDEAHDAFRSLQMFTLAGEAFPVAMAAQLTQIVSGQVYNMYGPTETTVYSSTYRVNGEQITVPIGRPIANTQIYILDRSMQPVPVGMAGEVFIGGDGVGRGYLNRPELTAERFIQDPFSVKPGALLYRTGDLATFRADGNIEYQGRIDHQVKIRGYRIELGEIETLLVQHPDVREAVVLAREDIPGDRRLVAYVIPAQNKKLVSNELRDYVKQKLPEYMVPSHFVALDAFPLTPSRKTDRRALPAPQQTLMESGTSYVAPEHDLERRIVQIWQEVLNVRQVGVEDNFFELGGHSLLIVQAHHRLREAIERDLSIVDLFRFPTIRTLSEYLSQASKDGGAAIVQRSVERARARREGITRRRRQRQTTGTS